MIPKILLLVLWFVCVLADVLSWLCMLASIVSGGKRAYRIALSKDQVYNVVIGGHIDEKISSRAWRMQYASSFWYYMHIFIDFIFWFDPNHCEKSFNNELIESQFYVEKAHIYLARKLQLEKAKSGDYYP